MYNAHKPTSDELPTFAQLLRSTAIAMVAAGAILITTVLPAEYGIDPTGVGRLLGLTEMGQIKRQHTDEVGTEGDSVALVAAERPVVAAANRSDEITITLSPGEETEVKLVMDAGAQARFEWTATGGVLIYDTHGDNGDQFVSYESGSGAPGDEGVLEAAFDGSHGWYWSNPTEQDVTVTLRTNGAYYEMKRVL
jgi:hypothetical protein